MSITLTQNLSLSIGGTVTETDTNAAATYMEVVWPNSIKLFFQYGNVSGSPVVFSQGAIRTQSVIVTLDLTSGNWVSSNGLSGTLNAAALTNINTTVKNWRNSAETFAVNNNIIVGAQVAWT